MKKNLKQIMQSKLTSIETEVNEIREKLWELGAQNMNLEEEIRREALELERDEILVWFKVQNVAENGGIDADIEKKVQEIKINLEQKKEKRKAAQNISSFGMHVPMYKS